MILSAEDGLENNQHSPASVNGQMTLKDNILTGLLHKSYLTRLDD